MQYLIVDILIPLALTCGMGYIVFFVQYPEQVARWKRRRKTTEKASKL